MRSRIPVLLMVSAEFRRYFVVQRALPFVTSDSVGCLLGQHAKAEQTLGLVGAALAKRGTMT